jgi:hypothetical protein
MREIQMTRRYGMIWPALVLAALIIVLVLWFS